LSGLQSVLSHPGGLVYDPQGHFEQQRDQTAEIGIAVLSEMPYAEGFGDRADLRLPAEDVQLIHRLRARCQKLVVILLSGRPLILTEHLPLMDALVAAWLPGTEGQGIADVLFGDQPFTGKLSYSWPRSMQQIPLQKEMDPLYPFGHAGRVKGWRLGNKSWFPSPATSNRT
jgi:beta-glucosidase